MLITEPCIGIDLGTTNSVVYNLSQGKLEAVQNSFGDMITPSVVFATKEGLIVGRAALNERPYAPEHFAANYKRHMGQTDENGNAITILTGPDGREHTPEDCTAALLLELKNSAEKFLNQDVKKVVITVPAYFDAKAKESVKKAGQQAGFEEIKLITEPVAATLAYDPKQGGEKKIAVFDFGGGTFDMSIIQSNGNAQYDVLSITGDQNLGGSDLDDLLVNYSIKEGKKQGCEVDPNGNLQVLYDLRDSCCRAKETLSRAGEATICVDNRKQICKVMIDRPGLKKLVEESIITKIEKLCFQALKKAKLTAEDIDIVLLVGGSSQNFFVPELIQKVFLQQPRSDIDMNKAVAMGAGVCSAKFFGKDDTPVNIGGKTLLPSEIEIKNICARNLCVAASKEHNGPEYNTVLIPESSQLPYTK
jgi:molecular chaperone DnaK